MTMWVTIGKVALVAYLLIAVTTIVVMRRRRMRARRAEFLQADPLSLRGRELTGQPGFEAAARGALPRTPLPNWMYTDDGP